MTSRLRKAGCLGAVVVAIALAAFAIHTIFYSKRTLLELHEAGGVTIKVWAEPYRWVDEASILWTVSRNGRNIIKHGFLEARLDPFWPHAGVLRSEDGTILGITDGPNPDWVLAIYDLSNDTDCPGDWRNFDSAKARAMLAKLQQNNPQRHLWLSGLAPEPPPSSK